MQDTPSGQGPTPQGTDETDANGTRLAAGRERGDGRGGGAGGPGGRYARQIDCSPGGQRDRAPADGHGRHR